MKYVIDVTDIDRYLLPSETRGSVIGIPMSVDNHKCIISTDIKYIKPYTEPDEIKNNKVNLCSSCELCKEHFPECGDVNVLFGDGAGNDNVCCCNGYQANTVDRKQIEDEVCEFVSKLLLTKNDDIRDCFGSDSSFLYILKNCSYQEAKSKYEAWKKQKEAIHVGDEVFHKDYPNDKVVVTRLYQSGYLCADILFPNGETDQEILVNNLVKTGRHFSEVEELLKKIKENK